MLFLQHLDDFQAGSVSRISVAWRPGLDKNPSALAFDPRTGLPVQCPTPQKRQSRFQCSLVNPFNIGVPHPSRVPCGRVGGENAEMQARLPDGRPSPRVLRAGWGSSAVVTNEGSASSGVRSNKRLGQPIRDGALTFRAPLQKGQGSPVIIVAHSPRYLQQDVLHRIRGAAGEYSPDIGKGR
jgi:hypothetical protein